MVIDADALVWTEGKTDWQHLKHAYEVLRPGLRLRFQESLEAVGDDQLLRQCMALSKIEQPLPTIFIFDRDKPETVSKVEDPSSGYKCWGNKVYSFAIPVPPHRESQYLCIEKYYSDSEIQTYDVNGRRLFFSSEFNPISGRHLLHPNLSVGQRKMATGNNGGDRLVDCEVYDEQHRNVALSKAEFAHNILSGIAPYANFNVETFRAVFLTLERIKEHARKSVDLMFPDLSGKLQHLDKLDERAQLGTIVDVIIRSSKLFLLTFAGAVIRFYLPLADTDATKSRRMQPVKRLLGEKFTDPSLTTIIKLARDCYHIVDDSAPNVLLNLKASMAETPTMGPLGDLLDDLERVIPPDARRGRTVSKRIIKKPVLDYILPELARYEGRTAEIIGSGRPAGDPFAVTFGTDHRGGWRSAVAMFMELLSPLQSLVLRLTTIERVQNDTDDFIVSVETYKDGRTTTEEVIRKYHDLTSDRLETTELVLDNGSALDQEQDAGQKPQEAQPNPRRERHPGSGRAELGRAALRANGGSPRIDMPGRAKLDIIGASAEIAEQGLARCHAAAGSAITHKCPREASGADRRWAEARWQTRSRRG